jgi:hypothetical protein
MGLHPIAERALLCNAKFLEMPMTELDKALADLAHIRARLAAGSLFQGFGPAAIAATGLLALGTAEAQVLWPHLLARPLDVFLGIWVAVAIAAAALIGAEMIARSRRHHGGLSTSMIVNALEQFVPAGFGGVAVAAVFVQFSPQNCWMLPGLWQIFVSLGIFAAARCLPRAVMLAGAWYFLAGTAALILASEDEALSPWLMGLPFGAGQLLMAAALHFAEGESNAR